MPFSAQRRYIDGLHYIPDLTASSDGRFFAVGYLDADHPFSTGAVPAELVERLEVFSRKLTQVFFGLHICQFCQESAGCSDFCVATEDSIFYEAPELIVHYITAHGYCPPAEFITAVLDTPLWQGEPIVLIRDFIWAQRLKDANRIYRGYLSPRYIAVRYKQPGLLANPRWLEDGADRPIDELRRSSRRPERPT